MTPEEMKQHRTPYTNPGMGRMMCDLMCKGSNVRPNLGFSELMQEKTPDIVAKKMKEDNWPAHKAANPGPGAKEYADQGDSLQTLIDYMGTEAFVTLENPGGTANCSARALSKMAAYMANGGTLGGK